VNPPSVGWAYERGVPGARGTSYPYLAGTVAREDERKHAKFFVKAKITSVSQLPV